MGNTGLYADTAVHLFAQTVGLHRMANDSLYPNTAHRTQRPSVCTVCVCAVRAVHAACAVRVRVYGGACTGREWPHVPGEGTRKDDEANHHDDKGGFLAVTAVLAVPAVVWCAQSGGGARGGVSGTV